MADEPREFIPKDNPEGDRMLVFELASKDEQKAAPPPPEDEPLPLTREPRRKPSRNGLLLGVAGAVALGAVLGLVARPELIGEPTKMQPARPPAEAPAPTIPQMQVMVRDAPDGPPAAVPAGPSEQAPKTQVAASGEQAAPSSPPAAEPPPAPKPAPPAQVAVAPVRPPEPPPRSAPAQRDPPAEAPRYAARTEPAPPRARPSFDCRYASTPSEQLVCADPQLAAADRRLARAYERAVAAGVPRRYLRAEQDDWLAIREQAARRSPRAVADIYEQRTAELNDMAIVAREGF